MLQVSNQPVGRRDVDAARQPVQELALVGVGGRAALQERARPVGGGQQRVEPAGSGPAVVVGERDQRCVGRAPAEVALRGRAGDARQPQKAHGQPLGRAGEGPAGVGVADHDHLEAPGIELAGERLEREGEPRLPGAGGDHHRYLGRRRAHSAANLLLGIPPVRTTIAVVVATHDRPARLARLLRALAEQERPADEVVVVADGSPASTDAVLAAERARGALPLRTIARPVSVRSGDRA